MIKKITRISIDALKEQMPLLNEYEQRSTLGGDGPGDCLFQTIAYIKGIPVSEVQQTYANYYNEQYFGGKMYGGDIYWLVVGQQGRSSLDVDWLMNQYGVDYAEDSGNGVLIINDGTHAVHAYWVEEKGAYYFYDPQNDSYGAYGGGTGVVSPYW